MKELKSILKKAVEDNIISEKGGLNGIYDACKQLGYKSSKEEFEKKFFELVKSEIESSCMVNEEDLDSIAGGKGDIAKRLAAFGLALAGPAMGMSSQVGATFEGMKNLNVKAQFKTASKKVDDFVNKNPVKAAKIAAGVSVAATGALSAALVAAGFGVKALAARISACPLLAINKWDDQGDDTKEFMDSFKKLDGIIGKQNRGDDGKVTSRAIDEDNLETRIGEIKGFFENHKLDEPVKEEVSKTDETTSDSEEDKTKKPEKKEESDPFNRIFQAVSRGNINKLRELVSEEEKTPETATADTQNQGESDEAKAAAKAKETAKKEAKIEKIYKYWEGAKADLKAAIQKAVKDPSIASKFVNLALGLQEAGLLGGEDLNDDNVHENFTRAKTGMDDAEREIARVRQEANKAKTESGQHKSELERRLQAAENALGAARVESFDEILNRSTESTPFAAQVNIFLRYLQYLNGNHQYSVTNGNDVIRCNDWLNNYLLPVIGSDGFVPSPQDIGTWKNVNKPGILDSMVLVLNKLFEKVTIEADSEKIIKKISFDSTNKKEYNVRLFAWLNSVVSNRDDDAFKILANNLGKFAVSKGIGTKAKTETCEYSDKNMNLIETDNYMKLIYSTVKTFAAIDTKIAAASAQTK